MSEWMLAHPIMTFILALFAIDGACTVFQNRARARLMEAKRAVLELTNGGEHGAVHGVYVSDDPRAGNLADAEDE